MKTQTILITALAASFMGASAQNPDNSRPNVILIMADDVGYECFGANGSTIYQTPNLDRLAREGMRFTRCHVTPLCTPSRVELMTGLYNVRNYVEFGILPRSERTFGHVFKEAGYVTGIFGKWQLGTEKNSPQFFGFDESYLWHHTRAGGPNRASRYEDPGLEINGKEHDFPGQYGPKVVNDYALNFITVNRDKPFLLYYPMILPHGPFDPTPDCIEWAQGGNTRDRGLTPEDKTMKYFIAYIAYMDKMVGNVLNKLDELGIRNNTLVIFLGDNGTHRDITSRFEGIDYQGGKGQTAAHGTHVPLFVGWPDKVAPNQTCDNLIGTTDFFPTICEAARIPVPEELDGVSFLPALLGQDGPEREWIYGWLSARRNPLNLTVSEYVHDGEYKLYRTGEIYDVVADPFEKKPLKPATLSSDAREKINGLNQVLDKFKDARPASLEKEAEERAARSMQE